MRNKIIEMGNRLKNKKAALLALYLLALVAGVFYPVSKIIRFEFPLVQPAVLRFKAELNDPYDPFRGRYVALQVEEQLLLTNEEKKFVRYGDPFYAVLERDEHGWGKVTDIIEKPEKGVTAIKAKVFRAGFRRGASGEDEKHAYKIVFPFYRFYMNEKLAPQAEKAFLNALKRGATCVVVAKIYADGNFAITDLEIDGVPIHKFLENNKDDGE